MSTLPRHLIRCAVLLLAGAAAFGCTSGDGPLPAPGSISLSLSQSSATVEQRGWQEVTATLTRVGGSASTVDLTVTGAPSGVTAVVSKVQTTGMVTTATVTIVVGASVPPAVYSLVVHGTGSTVSGVTHEFTLTVTPSLGFSVALSASALSIEPGANSPTTTVKVTRFDHHGAVGLYVAGLPTGVTGSFDPAAWPAADSTVLTLTVGATAVPGIYNLQVNAYDPEQDGDASAPLVLTVTAPLPARGYTLSLSASAVSAAQGAWSPITTVHLARTNFTGYVDLRVENLPTGVSAQYRPENVPLPGNPPAIWLVVDGHAVPGTYSNLLVRGVASGLADRTMALTLTITLAPVTLTLSSSTLSIAQGAASPTTTVNLVRNDFAGPVELYVGWDGEDHDVLPPGVTAAFTPSPATGNSAVLTLTVGAAATPGVYNLFVFAGASTGSFCCIPLTLTVTAPSAPGYALTLSSATLSIVQGASTPTTTVNLVRTGFTGPVTLYVDEDFHLGPMPPGMTAAFGPNPATGNSSVLTITVGAAAVPGVYELYVYGHASTGWSNAMPLTLTVIAASP